MTELDVDRLVQEAFGIRNRGKIQATVDKARAMMSASPDLAALAKSREITRTRAPRSLADLPKSTPQAETFARQLKSQGLPLRGTYQRVRVHAERRRGQRPPPRVLPRCRRPHHGPGPLTTVIRRSWRKNGLTMVAIGLGAAAVGFLIRHLFRTAGA